MFGPIPVRQFAADEGGPLALAKDLLISRNLWLESITWENTGSSTAYIQIFNVPRRFAVAITDTDDPVALTGVLTAAAHGFTTGDYVTCAGIDGVTTGYLRSLTANTFNLYTTRAGALAGSGTLVIPSTIHDTGTVSLTSDATTTPVCEEYPVLAAASAPSNVGSLTNVQFSRGLYVRAVTAAGGSTLIGSADIRFTPRYLTGPLAGTPAYED